MSAAGGPLVPDDRVRSRDARAGAGAGLGGRDDHVNGGFHVFVYGTLRSGGSAAGLLGGCARVGSAMVRGTLYDIDGRFPALLLYGDGCVHGEVWRCPTEMLPSLDEFEGVDTGLFRRIGVRAGDFACWAYVAGPTLASELTPARRIGSGQWRDPGTGVALP